MQKVNQEYFCEIHGSNDSYFKIVYRIEDRKGREVAFCMECFEAYLIKTGLKSLLPVNSAPGIFFLNNLMEKKMNTLIEINGVSYVRKDSISQKPYSCDGLEYVIVRTYSAGVHAGFLSKENGKLVTLLSSRRIWYWEGAASLSQLSVDGVSKPEKCKFSVPVNEIRLTEAIEIIPCTPKAFESISEVTAWRK